MNWIVRVNGYKLKSFSRTIRMLRKCSTTPETEEEALTFLRNQLGRDKLNVLLEKKPTLKTGSKIEMVKIVQYLSDHDRYNPKSALKYPSLLVTRPVTLEYRERVLRECGFEPVNIEHVSCFLNIIKRPIAELKRNQCINCSRDVQERLTEYLTSWPTYPPMQKSSSNDSISLSELRLKVLCRYLELNLNFSEEKFYQSVDRYPQIKHKPLGEINSVFHFIRNVIRIPDEKIIKNFAILHGRYENIQMILQKVKSLAGVDIREVLAMRPTLLNVNYKSLLKIQQLLDDFEIPHESQQKNFNIYSLSYDTIKTRLKELSAMPDFRASLKDSKMLKFVLLKKKVDIRRNELLKEEREFIPLGLYIGEEKIYKKFTNYLHNPSEKKNFSRYIRHIFKKKYSVREITNLLTQTTYYTRVPLTNIKIVVEYLLKRFSDSEIYENFQIILYPLDAINTLLNKLLSEKCTIDVRLKNVDVNNLSRTQILSLLLYYLENKHNFDSNGIWIVDKNKTDNVTFQVQESKQILLKN